MLVAYRDRSESEVRDISVVRFAGGRWSEPQLIGFAYDFEQATHVRVPPTFIASIGDALFPGIPNPPAAAALQRAAAPEQRRSAVPARDAGSRMAPVR